jgi:carbon storage regulator
MLSAQTKGACSIMLVLSRMKDESITLVLPDGGHIKISVVDIRGDKTRIGVDAAPEIYVYRTELVEEEGLERLQMLRRIESMPDYHSGKSKEEIAHDRDSYRPGDNLDITV